MTMVNDKIISMWELNGACDVEMDNPWVLVSASGISLFTLMSSYQTFSRTKLLW